MPTGHSTPQREPQGLWITGEYRDKGYREIPIPYRYLYMKPIPYILYVFKELVYPRLYHAYRYLVNRSKCMAQKGICQKTEHLQE